MVTTRVTTMGLVAPVVLSDVVVAGDRPAFFVVLDFEKNEESDVEGRTIVSDIIMDWVEGKRAPQTELYPDMIASHGIPVRSLLLTHPSHFPKLVEDGPRRRRRRRTQEEEEIQEGKG
jgi:hypothetical protein